MGTLSVNGVNNKPTYPVAAAQPSAPALRKAKLDFSPVTNVQASPGTDSKTLDVCWLSSLNTGGSGMGYYEIILAPESMVGPASALFPDIPELVAKSTATGSRYPNITYVDVMVDQTNGVLQPGTTYKIERGDPSTGYMVNIPDLAEGKYIVLIRATDGSNWTAIIYAPNSGNDSVEESAEVKGTTAPTTPSSYKIGTASGSPIFYDNDLYLNMVVPADALGNVTIDIWNMMKVPGKKVETIVLDLSRNADPAPMIFTGGVRRASVRWDHSRLRDSQTGNEPGAYFYSVKGQRGQLAKGWIYIVKGAK